MKNTKNLQPRQRGSVHFDTEPHGANIIIDGQILVDPDTEESIKTPAIVLLIEGRRDYSLELEGHSSASGYVDIFAGSSVNIFRNLEPIPGSNIRSLNVSIQYPYYPGIGDIFIDSDPKGGYIYIDGFPLVDKYNNPIVTPTKLTNILEGLHEIQISLDGYYSKKLIVNIVKDRQMNAYTKLERVGPVYLGPIGEIKNMTIRYIMDDSLRESYIKRYTIDQNLKRKYTMLDQPYPLPLETSGDVVITTYPAGASVCIDGNLTVDSETKDPITTPAVLEMFMGYHDLQFKLLGFFDEYAGVYVTPRSTQYVERNFNVC